MSEKWIKDTVKETFQEIVKELPICREGTGSEVSFNLDTADANGTFPPPERTDSDFGFGPDADPGIYDSV